MGSHMQNDLNGSPNLYFTLGSPLMPIFAMFLLQLQCVVYYMELRSPTQMIDAKFYLNAFLQNQSLIQSSAMLVAGCSIHLECLIMVRLRARGQGLWGQCAYLQENVVLITRVQISIIILLVRGQAP